MQGKFELLFLFGWLLFESFLFFTAVLEWLNFTCWLFWYTLAKKVCRRCVLSISTGDVAW